jgi:DNA-binding response OmpR family regulator
MSQQILLVDDDRDLAAYLCARLEGAGFGVTVVGDAPGARGALDEDAYDLVVLDTAMPDGAGFDLLRRISTDRRTSSVPVIVVTAEARVENRIHALRIGADDFIAKPFDAEELLARIVTVLRRARQLRDLSPLTGLPGNAGIMAEIGDRLERNARLAVVHVDIANFKAFNDTYGFLRGDGVISFCVECLRVAAAGLDGSSTFLGHIGGDDFVAVVEPAEVPGFCGSAIRSWDEGIGRFYDDDAAEQGWIETEDRRGELRRYPIATLSMGVATNEHRELASVWEASAIAAEMKEYSKRRPGSNFQVDRRTGSE